MPYLFNKLTTPLHDLANCMAPVFSRVNIPSIVKSTFASIGSITFNFLAPYTLGQSIIAFSENKTIDMLGVELSGTELAGLYGVFWTLGSMLTNVRTVSLSALSPAVGEMVAMDYVTNTITKQSWQYHVETSGGEMMGYIVKCYMAAPNISSEFLGNIVPAACEMSIAFYLLTRWYGSEISFGLLAMISLYIKYSTFQNKEVVRLREATGLKGQKYFDSVAKTFDQFQIIKQFGTWSYTKNRLEKIADESRQADADSAAIIAQTRVGQSLVSGVGLTSLALFIGAGIGSGRYTIIDYLYLINYLTQFYNSLSLFGNTLNNLFAAMTEMKLVLNEINKKTEIPDLYPDIPLEVRTDTASIEFRNVVFTYGKDHDGNDIKVLDDVSFSILPGQKVGIVGASGAGKSTIGNLIFRFYNINSGQILINGQDISRVGIESLQSAIGIVPQDPFLLNDTIYKNVEYGGLSATEKPAAHKIEKAIDAVCLADVVAKQKDGIHTIVGEQGAKLSGGQQQRLAIARMLMKDARIVILDEYTSALDANTERELEKNLDEMLHHDENRKTTLIFTHKFSSLITADKIVVIDQGKVVAEGTHAELINQPDSLYAGLWQQQQAGNVPSVGLIKNSIFSTVAAVDVEVKNCGGSLRFD